MKFNSWSLGVGLLALSLIAGCGGNGNQASMNSSDSLLAANPQEPNQNLTPQQPYPSQNAPRGGSPRPSTPSYHTVSVPSGTAVPVTVNASISTETAHVGDGWSGVVQNPVIIGGTVVIPAGSSVQGTVTVARPAQRGDRATLDLGLSAIEINGRRYAVSGGTEPIVAGSTRARNLGAIAGGAAAGALIGKAVGGSGKGAVIGGLIGGAAAGGAVAKSKGYQVELKPGTTLTFTVSEPLAVRQ